ncbi:hypothetical protein M2352_001808 [Azospirillum fermentarium]|uniref:hypothetical protein n=1 Tax=Azospirillum fermentarium TaxID=1233114 RepID=UPI00222641E7|nr:hypothetical protein [Azospirillum fermentarium]MCW2246217.1 hypothetical protein [Azospirillum fermentarium]
MTTLNGRPGNTPRPQTFPACLDSTDSHPRQRGKAIDPSRVAKAGYSVPEFCYGAGIGRSKAYELMGDGLIRFVTVGRRRIITDSPADFLARLAGNVEG